VSVREILEIGHPALRRRAREIPAQELAAPATQRLIDDMIETKRAAHGAGLAANQVGEALRVAVVEVEPRNPRYPYKPPFPLTVIVNPVLEPLSDEYEEIDEGCLSVPGLRGPVVRRMAVRVSYLDRSGSPSSLEASGLTAGTFQHEVDHLDGVLFTDRVADRESLSTWEQWEELRRQEFERRARDIVERYGG
jgi:peptide deformylase